MDKRPQAVPDTTFQPPTIPTNTVVGIRLMARIKRINKAVRAKTRIDNISMWVAI